MKTATIRNLTFTATEAAAFVQLPPERVHQEIDDHVISVTLPHKTLSFATLIYLRAFKDIDFYLPSATRKHCWQALTESFQQEEEVQKIGVSGFFSLDVNPIRIELLKRVQLFNQWKETLSRDTNVMGGGTVFPNSRLTVRHVGGMLEKGEAPDVILEDYPYLNDTDLGFAQLYVRAYPSD